MPRRLSDAQVAATYGNPEQFLGLDGTVNERGWKTAILGGFQLPSPLKLSWGSAYASRVSCHRAVELELAEIFAEIFANKEAWDSIGTYGGCYMFRQNRNNHRALSRHCWGLAIDIDVLDNQNGDSTPEMHPAIVEAFERRGWVWGAHFPTPDPMHFEKGTV